MKKLIILLLFLSVAVFWFYFLVGSESAPPVTPPEGSLSERAKEYLREQKNGSRQWTRLGGQDKPSIRQVLGGRRVRVGECFELEIPFPIESVKDKGDCFDLFRISSPRGRIAAYRKRVSVRALEEVPEVQMRRLKNDVYVEKRRVLEGREFLVFQKKGSDYQKTAFQLVGDRLFVLSFVAYDQADDFDGQFIKMLSSLEFLSGRPGGD
jgi:hypothetical protein